MKSRLITLLLRLLAVLPLPVNHVLGAVLGRLLVMVPNRRRSTTLTNMALCFPALDARDRRHLARASLIETGKGLSEVAALWFYPRKRVLKLVKGVSGLDALDAALRDGRGVIIAAPHLGTWEVIGLYCSIRSPMTILYRPPPVAAFDQPMRRARGRLGATLVPTTPHGVRALYAALGRGELVGILPDQDPSGGAGVFAPFFGIQANTMVLLSRLAAKSGAAVIFAYAERLPRGRGYHLHFHRARAEIYDKDVVRSATEVNAMVELCVREVPAQYLWCYKRFRTRPAGEPRLYNR